MANVQQPIDYLKSLDSDQPEIVVNSDGGVIPTIVPEKGKFLFITFNDIPSSSAESRAALLQSHDKIISELTKQISALHDNVIIIYTGESSNMMARQKREAEENKDSSANMTAPLPAAAIASAASESPITTTTQKEVHEEKVVKKTISLLTGKDDDKSFYNLDNVLIYYRNITIVSDKNEVLFESNMPVLTKHEEYWTVDMSDGVSHFSFNIINLSGRWYVDGAKWKGNDIKSKTIIGANDGFGFHCSPTIEFKQGKNIVLRWRQLQIEPNFVETVKMEKFGDSFDCVGFTSPGIWAGLFITFILIFILTIGMCWMLDIRTMDRFDDPKGKTITISVNE